MRHNYPKVMGRLSRFFLFVGWLNLLGMALYVIAVFRHQETLLQVRFIDIAVMAASGFAMHYILDFLLDMGEKIAYIEQIQQQQNKVLTQLHRANKETETLPS